MKRLIAAAALCLSTVLPAPAAQAATVLETGSTFQFTLSPSISGSSGSFGVVRPNTGPNGTMSSGAELDACIAGCGTSLDFGFGPDGDQFRFAISAFGNIALPRDTITFGVTGLSFVGGPAPFEIEILSSSYADAQVLNLTTSGFSVSFSGETPLNGAIIGRFAEVSSVPLPAGGVLLGTALLGFGVTRRRRAV
ncbi:VPLPA-CTERM sorting domain-containing protein [Rhodobacteraceae bacterium NNCM2]|nr:VPLPA-CTERM sorting domain-containing protein [Coraliihabitans acroporae]